MISVPVAIGALYRLTALDESRRCELFRGRARFRMNAVRTKRTANQRKVQQCSLLLIERKLSRDTTRTLTSMNTWRRLARERTATDSKEWWAPAPALKLR